MPVPPYPFLSRACAASYFPPGDGSCAPCPVLRNFWDRYNGVILLLVGILAFATLTYVFLLAIVRFAGGTVAGGARRGIALAVWGISTAQVLSQASGGEGGRDVGSVIVAPLLQVSQVSSPALPPLLASLYRGVAVLQVGSLVV